MRTVYISGLIRGESLSLRTLRRLRLDGIPPCPDRVMRRLPCYLRPCRGPIVQVCRFAGCLPRAGCRVPVGARCLARFHGPVISGYRLLNCHRPLVGFFGVPATHGDRVLVRRSARDRPFARSPRALRGPCLTSSGLRAAPPPHNRRLPRRPPPVTHRVTLGASANEPCQPEIAPFLETWCNTP